MNRLLTFYTFIIAMFLNSCKEKLSEDAWKNVEPGNMGMHIDMPYELTPKDMLKDLPVAALKRINRIETSFHEGKNIFYGVNVVEYHPGTQVSLPASVKGALSEMARKSQGKITNQQDKTEMINGNEANITTATIVNEKKVDMDLQMLLINKGNRMYQVMGVYKSGSSDDRETAKRIIQSVKIDE